MFSESQNLPNVRSIVQKQVTTAYKCALVLRDLVAPYLLRRYVDYYSFVCSV